MTADRTIGSVEELESLVKKGLDERQRRRERAETQIPEDLRLWLAVVPKWTLSLLEHVAKHRDMSWLKKLDKLLGRMERQGLVQQTVPPDLPGRETPPVLLAMDPEAAERELDRRLRKPDDHEELWGDIMLLGEAIREVAGSGDGSSSAAGPEAPEVPAQTQRWAALVAAAGIEDPGTVSSKVMSALRGRPRVVSWQPTADLLEQEVTSRPSGEALRWIEAAQPLAAVLLRGFNGTLDLAVRRSALRLELRDRNRHDLKLLGSFLERDDQIDALRRLFAQDGDGSDRWALHLIGSGGVGKTMLVRHLTARLALREHWDLTVARVDFDFLNPDYPRLAPGLLLWAFAQEFRIYDRSGSAGAAFDDAERLLGRLHDLLRAGEVPDGRATDHELFQEGIELYAQAIELLPEPVVLVIDTCEELTKPRTGLDSRFNVDETFRILEMLHDRVPSLRVVFSGRRPLAKEGAGWRCPSSDLPARDYLRLFEVRGFSVGEARTYLRRQKVPKHLVEPVIRRSSPDTGGAAEIEWLEHEGPAEVLRCNPYELRFFAEWARDDPPPSAEDIERAGCDRYVELRILRRLRSPEVARLLPIFGLARHLDEELLQALTAYEGDHLANLLFDLQQQEWIDRRMVPAGAGFRRILSVEEGLHLRLMSYYSQRPSDLEEQRRVADNVLRERILEWDPSELDATDLDAALRVVGGRAGAGRWWRQVEERLLAGRDADWVARQAEYLTGPEGVASLPGESRWPELREIHPLRPAVLATLALAEGRYGGSALGNWSLVVDAAASVPEIGRDLELRAVAMLVAGGHAAGRAVDVEETRRLWAKARALPGVPSMETAAAVVAACEALVEQVDQSSSYETAVQVLRLPPAEKGRGAWAPEWLHQWIRYWRPGDEAPWAEPTRVDRLAAMASCLQARIAARTSKDPAEAVELFVRAVEEVGNSSPGDWIAWREPEWLEARIRLEAIRALYPAVLDPADCFARFARQGPAGGIEGDRLRAAIARLGLAEGQASEAFRYASAAEPDSPKEEILCRAHQEIPPLAVQTALMDAATGHVRRAFRILGDLRRRADAFSTVVQQHTARAELDLAVRLRFLGDRVGEALVTSPEVGDQRLLDLSEVLRGDRYARRRPPRASSRRFFALLGRSVAEDLRLALDEWEATFLENSGPTLEPSDLASLEQAVERGLAATQRIRTRVPEEFWSLHLRRLALERLRGVSSSTAQAEGDEPAASLVERLGMRRAGLVAWREADLLALRQPAAAADLFATARRLLAAARDRTGEAVTLTAELCCLATRKAAVVGERLEELQATWSGFGTDLPPKEEVPTSRTTAEEMGLAAALEEVADPLQPWWSRALLLTRAASDDASVRDEVPALAAQYLRGPAEPMLAWTSEPEELEETDDRARAVDGGTSGTAEATPDRASPVDLSEGRSRPAAPASLRSSKAAGILASILVGVPVVLGAAVGLFLVGAFSLGLFYGVRAGGTALGLELPTYGWILLTLGAFVLAVWAGGAVAAVRAMWRQTPYLEVEIREAKSQGSFPAAPSSGSVDLMATMVSRTWAPGRWLPWRYSRERSDAVGVSLPAEPHRTPYARQLELADGLLFGLHLDPKPLQAAYVTPLVRPDLAWEGMLESDLKGAGGRTRRSVKEIEWPSGARARGASSAIVVAAPQKLSRDIAARGWRGLERFGIKGRMPDEQELESLFGGGEGGDRREPVVHLTGTVIEVHGGYRFRLATRSEDALLDLRPIDLPGRFPHLSLAILQEDPVAEVHPRSAADRRQAGWLRAFAAEVQRTGVPAVLTLPQLPPKLATACIEKLAELLRRRHRFFHGVLGGRAVPVDRSALDTVAEIRRLIRTDPELSDEVTWDVVLYAPAGWRNPYRDTRTGRR